MGSLGVLVYKPFAKKEIRCQMSNRGQWLLPTQNGKEWQEEENTHFFSYNVQYCVNFF